MVRFLHTVQGKHSTRRCILHCGDGLLRKFSWKIVWKVERSNGDSSGGVWSGYLAGGGTLHLTWLKGLVFG